MTHLDDINPKAPTWLELVFIGYLRLLALCFLGFSVFYWLRVTGYYEGVNWRFDTMTVPWKIASAMLSVLFPVSAVGLWSTLSWGQVVWTMAIVTELLMYNWFFELFGRNPLAVGFHLVTIVVFLAFLAANYFNTKKA